MFLAATEQHASELSGGFLILEEILVPRGHCHLGLMRYGYDLDMTRRDMLGLHDLGRIESESAENTYPELVSGRCGG